jgi:hypothetical protein
MTRSARPLLLSLVVACAAAGAGAQERAQADAAALPRARLQLDYRVSVRADDQSDDRLSISARGVAPVDLRLSGALFFGESPLGLTAHLAYEPYALSGRDLSGREVVLWVAGLRLAAGLALHASLGRGAALEGTLGYGYGRLPGAVASGGALQGGHAIAHGPELALALDLRRGALAPSLRIRATPYAQGVLGESHLTGLELAGGGQLGLISARLGAAEWQLVASYEYALERLSGEGASIRQGAHQVGLGLRASVAKQAERGLLPGRVRGVVTRGGTPVGAGVLVLAAGIGRASTDASGAFAFRSPPGPLTLRAERDGAAPVEKTITVPPDAEVEVALDLPGPTGPGRILGVVRDGAAPVAGVAVTAPGLAPVRTGEDGTFQIPAAGPGLVPLTLRRSGYVTAEEVVAVPPQGESTVELALRRVLARPMATLRGLVRTRAGKPLSARLHVLEADLAATTGSNGEFSVKVPGGRYRITLEVPGYIPQTKAVEVADGDQVIFNIDMHPAQ